MLGGIKVWFAINSTIGGMERARRQHGLQPMLPAVGKFLRGHQHTCKHIMLNRKCSAFEATARTSALLYWAVTKASRERNLEGLSLLATDFKETVLMAVSKDGESGIGSRDGMWQSQTVAQEIISEMENSHQAMVEDVKQLLMAFA